MRGIKLKLCRNVHNISLYKKGLFLLPLLMYFRCYGNLKFPLTYNGKSENWLLLLSHCRYFYQNFTEMCLDSAAAKKYFFRWVQPAVRDRLTYIEMFTLNSSLRKPSCHFGVGGDILGQKTCFFDRKMRKTGITLQNSRNPPVGHNFTWLTSEHVLNKTRDAIINEKYIFNHNVLYLV